MKYFHFKGFFSNVIALFLYFSVYSQGLPPGWEYIPTPSTHIISVKLSVNPNINGYPIMPGDYIGVFYLDNSGEEKCGGAVEWLGNQNTGLIAFGDDSFTPVKDGFSSGEFMQWKVYSWSVEKAYNAVVTCDPSLPCSCIYFTPQCLAGLATFDATGFYLVANASPDSICQGELVQLSASPSGGSGAYSYFWFSIPAGFTSAIPAPQAFPEITTQYFVQVTDIGETLTLDVTVSVFQPPSVSCGPDQSICEDHIVSLNGIVSNGDNILWSSGGDGQFSDPASLNTQYTPGINDIISGQVTLSLTAQPFAPCTLPVSDQLLISIHYLPFVEAGLNQSICEDEIVVLTPTISHYSAVLWETSGDGTFTDPNSPQTGYTPGNNDKINGFASLSVTAFAILPCIGEMTDLLSLSITSLPMAYAGEDEEICQNSNIVLSGEATSFSTIEWSTSGDGSFDNMTMLNSAYYPGYFDILDGNVLLTLTAQPISPCELTASDVMLLTIIKLPVVYAGPDATVCNGLTHQVAAIASHYEESLWVTSGDGTFDNPNALVTIYTPGSQDILNGVVQLSVTVLPEFPCEVTSQDELTLSFQSLPVAYAGEDATITSNETFQLNGMAEHFSTVFWNTSGDGMFTDPSIFDPVYTPGTLDISNGSTMLTMSAFPISPCSIAADDSMLLTIDSLTSINDSYTIVNSLIYPNPAHSTLNILWPDRQGKYFEVRLMDCTGKTLLEKIYYPENSGNSELVSIEIEGIRNGLYFIELKGKTQSVVRKLIISH